MTLPRRGSASRRAASITPRVPDAFPSCVAMGSSTDRCTDGRAARWPTAPPHAASPSSALRPPPSDPVRSRVTRQRDAASLTGRLPRRRLLRTGSCRTTSSCPRTDPRSRPRLGGCSPCSGTSCPTSCGRVRRPAMPRRPPSPLPRTSAGPRTTSRSPEPLAPSRSASATGRLRRGPVLRRPRTVHDLHRLPSRRGVPEVSPTRRSAALWTCRSAADPPFPPMQRRPGAPTRFGSGCRRRRGVASVTLSERRCTARRGLEGHEMPRFVACSQSARCWRRAADRRSRGP